MLFKRSTYEVWRTCQKCKGTGENGTRAVCYCCNGQKRQAFELLAHELTAHDLQLMSDMDRMSVQSELQALHEHNRMAREASESFRWEDERSTVRVSNGRDTFEVPIQDLRGRGDEPIVFPTGQKDIRAWKRALIKADMRERESGESRILGRRSDSLRSQRLVS